MSTDHKHAGTFFLTKCRKMNLRVGGIRSMNNQQRHQTRPQGLFTWDKTRLRKPTLFNLRTDA